MFEAYLGIEVRDPEPIRLEDEILSAYVGRYETIASTCDVTVADGSINGMHVGGRYTTRTRHS